MHSPSRAEHSRLYTCYVSCLWGCDDKVYRIAVISGEGPSLRSAAPLKPAAPWSLTEPLTRNQLQAILLYQVVECP